MRKRQNPVLGTAKIFFVFFASLFLRSSALSGQSQGRTFLFGWSWVDITPPKPVALCGQYQTRISGKVHDRIGATALAVEAKMGSHSTAVLVSCDLVAIRKCILERVRERLRELAPGLDYEKIVISCTHTHTAPALTDATETSPHPYDFLGSWAYRIPPGRKDVMHPKDYVDFLVERLSQVIASAWKKRAPGKLSWALSHAVVAHNRRAVYKNGRAVLYGSTADPSFSHIEGTSDHSVDLLFFWKKEQLEGIAVVLYCPSQEVEGQNYISADFWYDTRKILREKFNRKLFVLPLCGASGDQSPHVMWNKAAEANLLSMKKRTNREEIAFRILNAVEKVFGEAQKSAEEKVSFSHTVRVVPLPVRRVSEKRMREAKKFYEEGKRRLNDLSSRDYINWRVSGSLLRRYELQKKDPFYKAEIHALRFGDFALVTDPFELYVDYGIRIKARSPAKQTGVVQLTCGCAGYLPTLRAVEAGGYSARVVDGIVGPEGGEVLVERSVSLLKELFSKGR